MKKIMIAFAIVFGLLAVGAAIQRTPFVRNIIAGQTGTITTTVATDTLSVAYLVAASKLSVSDTSQFNSKNLTTAQLAYKANATGFALTGKITPSDTAKRSCATCPLIMGNTYR